MLIIENKLSQILKENKIAGMSVAITNRSDTIYAGGFGVDNVERPQVLAEADSLYRIASISKIITGVTIMRLTEEGILNLDTPVNEYITCQDFKEPQFFSGITLRHLLSHTSGLPVEYTPDGPREEDFLEQTLIAELNRIDFKSLPALGSYIYSNLGIRFASYIAQCRTKTPFSKLMDAYVLKPLNMSKTTCDLRVAATFPLSLPHTENEDGELTVVHYIKENATRLAAGGLYSNVIDLCKLARFLLNDGKNDSKEQILKPCSLKQMFTPHVFTDEHKKDAYGLTMMM